ncbi:MAG: hypothetical protein Q8Q09_12555 [Deltaproteobacteria bacterium]|nr:hypothetical protein [Deltaproteobacteria bacterium]
MNQSGSIRCFDRSFTMVSATQQSSRIRRRKTGKNGKSNKRERRLAPTPAFPIHQVVEEKKV